MLVSFGSVACSGPVGSFSSCPDTFSDSGHLVESARVLRASSAEVSSAPPRPGDKLSTTSFRWWPKVSELFGFGSFHVEALTTLEKGVHEIKEGLWLETLMVEELQSLERIQAYRAMLSIDEQPMESSRPGSPPVLRKQLCDNLEAEDLHAEGSKRRKKKTASKERHRAESSTWELLARGDEAIEAKPGQIEAALGSASGVKALKSSYAPLEFIEVEGNSPHPIPEKEARERERETF
ncbi:uncharacterized protein A4U43_C04F33700 [Asparagus officinalis]|uniref:Uncharacterized protein n=1 Tax=Asparagus officinalis TaxID=4686 RepID=A0A5P1F5L6_ASPOF|nr:uncharacterized protein A4U43_C04F33700 [Asparagus officinalis]